MKNPDQCRNLDDVRGAIDAIDNSIVEQIALRSKYVMAAARFKTDEKGVRDKKRVKMVIGSKRDLAVKYGISPDLVEKIYTIMIGHFISEELKEWKK
ncbi:MAG: chorismate mutase [Spirochaetales bacterium]|nr:chorismate mutase [Spirochaetales bacterium]